MSRMSWILEKIEYVIRKSRFHYMWCGHFLAHLVHIFKYLLFTNLPILHFQCHCVLELLWSFYQFHHSYGNTFWSYREHNNDTFPFHGFGQNVNTDKKYWYKDHLSKFSPVARWVLELSRSQAETHTQTYRHTPGWRILYKIWKKNIQFCLKSYVSISIPLAGCVSPLSCSQTHTHRYIQTDRLPVAKL